MVGQGGRPSLRRSALVEAVAQLTRALVQIAALPSTPAMRRRQIELQVALITPLLHVKGYAAPETKAAVERARLLIEQAEALGERSEDPLLLFSSSTVSGSPITWRSTAMSVEISLRSSWSRREARGDRAAHDGASSLGYFFADHGRYRWGSRTV